MIRITVTESAPAEGAKGRYRITAVLEDGTHEEHRSFQVFRYFLGGEPFSGHVPEAGELLNAERFEALELASSCTEAVLRAVSLLAYGDITAKKLTEKLKRRGFSADACAGAVDFLEKKRYLREEEYLARFLQVLCDRKLFGIRRLRQEVYAKGFSDRAVSAVWEDTVAALDFDAALDRRIKKLGASAFSTPEQNRRTTASLLRYGFTYDEISRAKKRRSIPDEDDIPDGDAIPDDDTIPDDESIPEDDRIPDGSIPDDPIPDDPIPEE